MEDIIAILCVFIGFPVILFGFIYKNRKNKTDLLKTEEQKNILELELEKERTHLKILEEENKKYDTIINNS
jgi:hypothetical protein